MGLTYGFWFKNNHASNVFFLGNIGQENIFYDILDGKNAFLRNKKTRSLNSQKLTFFQKG